MDAIENKPVKRRRSQDPNKPDKLQYTYKVHVGGEAIFVCRNTFLDLHGITEAKLRLIILNKKQSPSHLAKPDMRGKS